MRPFFITGTAFALSGCAQLVFNPTPEPDALAYFEPVPHLYIVTNKDCTRSTTLLMLPGPKRSVSLRSGYGSADLSVNLSNGMIQSVGQKTDTKIPETITALTGVAKTALTPGFSIAEAKGKPGEKPSGECPVSGSLYHLDENGKPDRLVTFPGK